VADITTLVSNEDITVLGPPSYVDVLVDVGPTGIRGSQVLIGTGNPNDPNTEIGQTPELNDLFINNATGNEYSWMYQYVSVPGGNTWTPILKVNPTIYSLTETVGFTAGVGSVGVPISNIVQSGAASLTAANFSIQFSVGNDKPVSAVINSVSITGATLDTLTISFKALEYDGGTWINLADNITVHLLITIVYPVI
jgi:hypothetical protein